MAPQFLGYFRMCAEVIAGAFSQLAVEGVALALHDFNRLHWKSLIENVVANLATLGLSRIEGVPLLTLNAKGVLASQSMESLVQSDALVK